MPDALLVAVGDLPLPDDLRVALLLAVITVTGIDLGIAAVIRAGTEAGREKPDA